jgi:tRNA(Ile)-lysidine synthase
MLLHNDNKQADMSLYSETLQLIDRHRLLSGATRVVVGISGGPDSVCLLDLLSLMRQRGDLEAELHAAHLNHGLRGADADADEAFVRELAESKRIPLTIEKRNVAASHARRGGSLEEVARDERYDFFASVADEVDAQVVAVGHHAGDQAETVLHRILRGAGLRGLRGIPLSRLIGDGSAVRVVRPLLRARRDDLLEHLAQRGLVCREDTSNADVTLRRNRIRHELIPLLERDYNPGVRDALLRLSHAATDAAELLDDLAHTEAAECVAGPSIDIWQYSRVHGALRPLLVDRAVGAAATSAPQFDATHYEAIDELAFQGEPGARLDLPGGIVATRSRQSLTFAHSPATTPAPEVYVLLDVPGRTAVAEAGVTVSATLLDRAEFALDAFVAGKSRYDEALDAGAVSGGLVLRTRRDGDVFHPLGAPGRKKVGDFLTDRKVPESDRDRVLLVADECGPVWIVGHRIDERVKVGDATRRVVKLSVERT